MERKFDLIKNDIQEHQKRVLPRFPYSYLTFKCTSRDLDHAFEVADISTTGMQLALKEGEHDFSAGNKIEGNLHWQGSKIAIRGLVKWTRLKRLGVEFSLSNDFSREMRSFLSLSSIASHIKPLHKSELERPRGLKIWLQADGPVEIFAWCHSNGEFEKIQFIIMQNFIEWVDGKGLSTARVLTKRDLDTPLLNEDEFVFLMDQNVNPERLNMANQLLSYLSSDLLDPAVRDFLKLKLGQ